MKSTIEIGKVYLVNFEKTRNGHEFYGKHFAVALTKPNSSDHTLLVAPITGKKNNKKYKGGITLSNNKYQTNPTYEKCFLYLRKIKEIDINKITYRRKPKKDKDGNILKDKNGNELFDRIYTEIFSLDLEDTLKLKEKLATILSLNTEDSTNNVIELSEQLVEEKQPEQQGQSV